MFLFGHAGITVGTIWLAHKSALWVNSRRREPESPGQNANPASAASQANPSLVKGVVPSLDYRLLLVGSMLPDIIDKPLGIYILGETLSSGYIFGHILLFAAVLAGVGLYLYVKRQRIGALCSPWAPLPNSFWTGCGLCHKRSCDRCMV